MCAPLNTALPHCAPTTTSHWCFFIFFLEILRRIYSFLCLFIYETGKGRRKAGKRGWGETERAPDLLIHFPNIHNVQAKAMRWELNSDLIHGWQVSNYIKYYRLPSRVHFSKNRNQAGYRFQVLQNEIGAS